MKRDRIWPAIYYGVSIGLLLSSATAAGWQGDVSETAAWLTAALFLGAFFWRADRE